MKALLIILTVFLYGVNAESKTNTNNCCNNGLTYEECVAACGTSAFCESGSASGITNGDLKCIVSGEMIEGDAVTYTYLGKEYSFCCGGCVAGFKKEPIKYIDGLKCPVMGNDAKANVTTQIDGVSYYFCCPPCIDEFSANFEKYNTPQIETIKSEDATEHKH